MTEELAMPIHLAISVLDVKEYASKNEISLADAYRKVFGIIESLVKFQIQSNLRILTFFIMPAALKKSPDCAELIEPLAEFFSSLGSRIQLNANQIKISVLGKWYDLPGQAVDSIKNIISETKEYDKFFLNFCINYDGQDEIVDACQLIARQIKAGKLDIEAIDKVTVKENIYSSFFMPPEIIILVSERRKNHSFLLWDSVGANFFRIDKTAPELSVEDVVGIIKEWNEKK